MITFDAFLIFLVAASIPVAYIFIVRHFLEGGTTPSGGERVKSKKKAQDRARYATSYQGRVAMSH